MNFEDHCKIDELLLGKTLPVVHSIMDESAKYLGSQHRFLKHDFQHVQAMEHFFGKDGGRIALLHILIDEHIIDDEFLLSLLKKKRRIK